MVFKDGRLSKLRVLTGRKILLQVGSIDFKQNLSNGWWIQRLITNYDRKWWLIKCYRIRGIGIFINRTQFNACVLSFVKRNIERMNNCAVCDGCFRNERNKIICDGICRQCFHAECANFSKKCANVLQRNADYSMVLLMAASFKHTCQTFHRRYSTN